MLLWVLRWPMVKWEEMIDSLLLLIISTSLFFLSFLFYFVTFRFVFVCVLCSIDVQNGNGSYGFKTDLYILNRIAITSTEQNRIECREKNEHRTRTKRMKLKILCFRKQSVSLTPFHFCIWTENGTGKAYILAI